MPDRADKKRNKLISVGSVSTPDDPLVEAETDREVKIPAFASLSMRQMLVASLFLLLVFVILVSVGLAVGVYFFATRGGGGGDKEASVSCAKSPLYVNLVLDVKAVPACGATLSSDSALPCLRNSKLLTGGRDERSESDPLGPMTCRDDAFSESRGCDNCRGNPFRMAENGTAVVIPETGVYRVHSVVTFADKLDHYVSTIIRVVPAECGADPVCQYSRAHAWLSCFNHNRPVNGRDPDSPSLRPPPASPSPPPFSVCAIDGVRRFNRGDSVSLHVTQRFRSINPFHKVTYLVIHKL